MFKFQNGQKVFVASTAQEVMVIGRTEFLDDRQPRYCIQADEGSIIGKNMHQDWINEEGLLAEAPTQKVLSEPEFTPQVETETGKHASVPVTQGKKVRDMKVRDIKA